MTDWKMDELMADRKGYADRQEELKDKLEELMDNWWSLIGNKYHQTGYDDMDAETYDAMPAEDRKTCDDLDREIDDVRLDISIINDWFDENGRY